MSFDRMEPIEERLKKERKEGENFFERETDRESPTSIVSLLSPWDIDKETLQSLFGELSDTNRHSLSDVFQTMKDDKRSLEQANETIKTLQEQVEQLQNQKTKIVNNLKAKKIALATKTEELEETKQQLKALKKDHEKVLNQNGSLRSGLQNICDARDALKTKLCVKREFLKEAQDTKVELTRELKKLQEERETERELLDLYRELARHTGYYQYGKQIRVLENKLSEEGK